MRGILRLIVLAIVISIIAISGCSPDTPTFPMGEYIDNEGHINNFMSDGRFNLKLPDGTLLIKNGHYSIDGDIIILTETEICPPVDGKYRWTYIDDELLFELIEDGCTDRASTITQNNVLKAYP